MPACSAYGCTNRPGNKIKGISFHRFPKNPTLRKAWVIACRRVNWSPSNVSVLCSQHFSEDQIDRTSFKNAHLKEKAVPNIFKSYSSNYQKCESSATMPACSAVGCANRSDRNVSGVSFHRFPKEAVLRAAWIVACRKKNWLPSPFSVLCSEHFSKDLIDRTSKAKVHLRENAIPTIFKYPSKESDLQKISEKHKSPEKQLASTPTTAISSDEETQSCDERTSETTDEETAVSLNSPGNESSSDYELSEPILEEYKSPERRLAFKATEAFLNDVIQSSNDSTTETPTIHHVKKPTVTSNSSENQSNAEIRLPVQIPKVRKSSKKCLPSTALTTFLNNKMIQLGKGSIYKAPAKCDVIQTTACLTSPLNESSVENRPPVQISNKHKFPEKCLASRDGTTFSDKEIIKSSDESKSKTATEYCLIKPIVCSNSSVNKSNTEILVQKKSNSELYPTEDIEKINLKRQLEEANYLITMYRKKIKILQQQNRRWKKQLEKVKRSFSVLEKTNKSVFL